MGKKVLTKGKKEFFYLSLIYILIVAILVPLAMDDGYFNITDAKAKAFRYGTVLLVACAATFLLIDWKTLRNTVSVSRAEKGMLMFLAVSTLSSIFSKSFALSLVGADGWKIGLYALSAVILFYMIIRRNAPDKEIVMWILTAVNLCILLFVILDSCKIDLLGFHKELIENQYFSYVSTIGNINWMAGYLCILVPLFFVDYLSDEMSARKKVSFIVLLIALADIVLCNSEGLYLGLGVCGFLLVPYCLFDTKRLKKTGGLFLFFGVLLLIIRFIPFLEDKRATLDGISALLINWWAAGTICIVGILIYSFSETLMSGERARVLMSRTAVVLMILAALSYIVIAYREIKTDYYHWGSGRGAIWAESWRVYWDEYSVLQKLIGVGPDMLGDWYANLSIGYGIRVLVSHSEPIQVIMSTGILGFAAYVFTIYAVISEYSRQRKEGEYLEMYFFPVVAYFGQSFVNSANTADFVLFFMILSLFAQEQSEVPKRKKESNKQSQH